MDAEEDVQDFRQLRPSLFYYLQIFLNLFAERPSQYDLLDTVVVRPEAAIVYIPCQLGHMRERIVHRLGHW